MPVNYTNGLIKWYAPLNVVVYEVLSGQGDMRDAAFDTGVIIADAVALAELPGGVGHERVRIDWLRNSLAGPPGSRPHRELRNE
jgi:hypothetical protein